MKKMVVLSLLVLNFPLVAFADTSESIPDKTVSSSQEQVIDSASILEETENQLPATDEIFASKEDAIGSQDISTDVTAVTEETVKTETTTENSITSNEKKTEAESKSDVKAFATIVSQQESTMSKKSQSIIEKELNAEWTAERFRKNLNMHNYGISQFELDSYTDEEMENAGRLFTRYNFDLTGMDLGSYVRVLRMLYKDEVISWADAEKALLFNPHDYQTTTNLAQNIDELQNYLHILHPDIRHFTNEELIYILNELSKDDKLGYPNGLFSGILYRLINYPEVVLPVSSAIKPFSPIQNMGTTSPVITNVATIPDYAKPIKEKTQVQIATQKEYPKTGENRNFVLTLIGITLFIIAGIMILKRRVRL